MATTRTSSAGKVSFGSWESEEREHPQGCSLFARPQGAEILQPERAAFLFLPHCAGVRIKGDILFLEREYPPYTPKRKDFHCKRAARRAAMLADCTSCVRQSRIYPCYTTWRTPIIRCRSAHLALVQPNFRLPEHSSMRRAKQCRIPQAVCRQSNVTRASR